MRIKRTTAVRANIHSVMKTKTSPGLDPDGIQIVVVVYLYTRAL